MEKATDVYGILLQNFMDAGCGDEIIEKGMMLAKSGHWEAIIPLINKEKENRIIKMHTSQKQIDCLDFLAYQIQKKIKRSWSNESVSSKWKSKIEWKYDRNGRSFQKRGRTCWS